MTTRFISLLMAVSTMGAAALLAQEGATKPAEGTLKLDKKTYTLKHALAYETTIDKEEAIGVVLSNQAAANKSREDPLSGTTFTLVSWPKTDSTSSPGPPSESRRKLTENSLMANDPMGGRIPVGK